MTDDQLPAGVQDFPGEGWPMWSKMRDLDPHPVRVGGVDAPQTFHTSIFPDDGSWGLTLFFAIEDSEVLLSAALAGGGELPDVLERVRALRPLRWWQRRAFVHVVGEVSERAAASIFDDGEETWDVSAPSTVDLVNVQRSQFMRERGRAAWVQPLGKRRNRVTEAFLAEVADTYRRAYQAGDPPTRAVAETFDRPHSTAAHWVSRARKAGLLGPADGSRGGEVE